MARMFNQIVFQDWVAGAATPVEVFSDPQYNDLLGQAENTTFEVDVMDSKGTNPTLTVTFYRSNDGMNWVSRDVIVNGTTISSVPAAYFADSMTGCMGAYGRVGVKTGASATFAFHLKVIACGRSAGA